MTPVTYQPPGTSVAEVVTPQVSPLLGVDADISLVGPTSGYQTRTDQFVLSGTTAIPLPGLAIIPGSTLLSVISVTDALNPSKGAANGSGYVLTTDYTVQTGAGTITRVGAGGITDPTLVNVTYTYIPAFYWSPIRLFDLASVESRFGSALDPTGTQVNSPLSFAAGVAFENGASSIICQPLFVRATPGDPTSTQSQPNATQIAASTTWSDTLFALRGQESLNIVVPVVGQSATLGDSNQLSIFNVVQDHLAFQNNLQQYIVAIFGEDSTTSTALASANTIRTVHAPALQGRYGGALNQQTVLVNTSRFGRSLPTLGQQLALGGQYMAAAVAGQLASRPTSSSLTRSVFSSFTSVLDTRTLQDKNADAQAGLFVVEQKGGSIRCRHAITLDTTSVARSELSVVRAKFNLIDSIRQTLENQVIGQIIADGNSPYVVRSAVVGVLESLRQRRALVDYSQVDARLLTNNPTTVEVRFSYRPAFVLNYINVVFSIDLSTSTVNTGAAAQNNPAATI